MGNPEGFPFFVGIFVFLQRQKLTTLKQNKLIGVSVVLLNMKNVYLCKMKTIAFVCDEKSH